MKTLKDVERLAHKLQPGLAYEYNKVNGYLYMIDYETRNFGMWLCKARRQEITQAYDWLVTQQVLRASGRPNYSMYRVHRSRLQFQFVVFFILIVLLIAALTIGIVYVTTYLN